jgi:segregation and condensation protein A
MNTLLHVEIGNFQGSLELLVHLAQKKEFSLLQIEITRLVEQLKGNEAILADIDFGATVVDLLSLLVCLKSRELLPFEEEEEDELLDPNEALEQMSRYAQFKGPASYLIDCEEIASRSLPRGDVPFLTQEKKTSLGIDHLGLEELRDLFQQAARHIEMEPSIEAEVWTVSEALDWIEEQLTSDDPLDLLHFFTEMPSKEALIVAFLAILELLKEGKVYLSRDEEQQICLIKRALYV